MAGVAAGPSRGTGDIVVKWNMEKNKEENDTRTCNVTCWYDGSLRSLGFPDSDMRFCRLTCERVVANVKRINKLCRGTMDHISQAMSSFSNVDWFLAPCNYDKLKERRQLRMTTGSIQPVFATCT